MGIKRERNGWRAYTRVARRLHTKRFSADTPTEEMEAWIASLRASPPDPPEAERLALEFWRAYRSGWIVGLLKTPHGWKVQVSVHGRLVQNRFARTASVLQMLTWRDSQRLR